MKIASEKDIEEFVENVKESIDAEVERVFLYGSYARDEHDTGSDVDLAFIVDGEVDESRAFEVVDSFRRERSLAFSPRFFDTEEFESKAANGYTFYKQVQEEGIEI